MEITPQIVDGHTDGGLSTRTEKSEYNQVTCLDDHEAELLLLRLQNQKLQQQLDGFLQEFFFLKLLALLSIQQDHGSMSIVDILGKILSFFF